MRESGWEDASVWQMTSVKSLYHTLIPDLCCQGWVQLYGKAFSAAAGAGGVGVLEVKTLARKAVGEVQFGVHQVQEAFQVGHYLHAVVLKHLVGRLDLVVEVHLVAQAGAAAAYHADAQEVGRIIAMTGLPYQLLYFFSCFVGYRYCVV